MKRFHTFSFFIISSIFKILGVFPKKLAIHCGHFFGNCWYLIDRKHRRIAFNNLKFAYGSEISQDEIRILTKQVFRNLSLIPFELGWSMRLDPGQASKFIQIRDFATLKKAHDKGRGVLILTGHLGAWELLPLLSTMELKGLPANIVYRPFDLAPLEDFFARLRTQFGAKLIKKSNALREVMKCLKRGELVALLMDQNVGWRKGVFVEFFGHRACTNKGLALLALKTRAPVVPMFLVRAQYSCYSVHIGEALPLITTGDRTRDLEANTQQYNSVIESFVRRYPDQWLWVHRRWKTRPYKPWPRKGHTPDIDFP